MEANTAISTTDDDSTTVQRNDDDDSTRGKGEDDDETRSLTDSIRQHVVDGNLRYHAYHAGTYAFPNDEAEQYSDDVKHGLTVDLCDGRLFLAPCDDMFERGAQVLDLVADLYPNSRFHGMDLSPIQPVWVPENVEFFVDDVEDEEGWAHLKPGGYVEVQEFQYQAGCDDTSCNRPYALRDFLTYLEGGLSALGSDLNAARELEAELAAAGFVEVGGRERAY
ncbi:hypothetical protein CDD80_246 [Ophiocordyceps camponoti-rufipedis]|uniref:Uncharacterized protein n=1 Tax=Ophiocordyceps camponoti-rufipedis TaxID=2004952 RepID=A0A2C5ZDD2_9HYPO|nr:hypothetical protein CDD80_246 [Ophiocordyceps camponoti-rufipedis]